MIELATAKLVGAQTCKVIMASELNNDLVAVLLQNFEVFRVEGFQPESGILVARACVDVHVRDELATTTGVLEL